MLRRLQKKSDPVAIEVKGPIEIEAIFPHLPDIAVALVNQDEKRTPIGFQEGGDYRSGRQERWRIEVRDAMKNHVPGVADLSRIGGGFTGYSLLKPNQKWHTTLHVRNFVQLVPGDYTLRVQYHDTDSIASMNWLGGRIVCQSEEIRLHVQPRVIDRTEKEKETIAELIEKVNGKEELRVLAASYSKGYHDFITPDSPEGRLLSLGWKAVPQMIDEVVNEVTPPRRRAWLLGLLFSITTYHDPRGADGVLPDHRSVSGGWSVQGGFDDRTSSGGGSFGSMSEVRNTKRDMTKQLEFAGRWEAFHKYLVVRSEK
jgi:hypothetical protein